ncbi:MAG: hypothetical protein WA814_11870 [Candidatus Baltobacteraceae bacterium]
MSDINIQITWWQVGLWTLAMGFWPLTAVAAAAAYWLWRQRASRIARVVAVVAIGLWAVSAAGNIIVIADRQKNKADYEAQLRARQSTLAHPAVVAGIALPAGTVVTRGDSGLPGDIAAIDLPAATNVRGVPVVGHAGISDGALDGEVKLERDTMVQGISCSASDAVRFDAGKLISCRLTRPSRVRGVPCAGTIDMQVGLVCILGADYARFGYVWRAQTKLTDFGYMIWFHIGALPPNLYAFGMPLPPDSEVQFQHDRIASVDLRSAPRAYRGCKFDLILFQSGVLLGETSGVCNLPTVPPGYVKLPASTISVR